MKKQYPTIHDELKKAIFKNGKEHINVMFLNSAVDPPKNKSDFI